MDEPTWVIALKVPLVSAKSAAVGALLRASLKVTVNVSAALLKSAVMLSVTVTVGAKVSMRWLISSAPACGKALPATSVKVEVVAMLRLMLPDATPALGVPTTV